MNYFELCFKINPPEGWINDLFAAALGEIGFESFVETGNGLIAYINEELFDEKKIDDLIKDFPHKAKIDYETHFIKAQDWNNEWEKNYFQPIIIGDECVIRSSFHTNTPKAKYDIVIDPKMSFGTGHHETTSLMISKILSLDLEGKSFLDMGCGTGILAILAGMRGADPITAIDNDRWVYENAVENIQRNKLGKIEVKIGDASLLKGRSFDVIFANINRNILIKDMREYANCLNPGGELYMSGFYEEDIKAIKKEAAKYGLEYIGFEEKNSWVSAGFKKP